MSANKVHVIKSYLKTPQEMQDLKKKRNLSGDALFGLYVEETDALGAAIVTLAAKTNEPVWFHEIKEPVGGAPVILLECSDTFLDAVKKLPGFESTHPFSDWSASGRLTSQRSANVQNYFTGKTTQPTAPKPPKP